MLHCTCKKEIGNQAGASSREAAGKPQSQEQERESNGTKGYQDRFNTTCRQDHLSSQDTPHYRENKTMRGYTSAELYEREEQTIRDAIELKYSPEFVEGLRAAIGKARQIRKERGIA
jgi:hypothetical protein